MTTTIDADIAALHCGVLADPLDDLPRLLYADALEERGWPLDGHRAAFIRAQMEYAAIQSEECVCGYVPWNPCDVCRLRGIMAAAGVLQNVLAVSYFADVYSRTPSATPPGSYCIFRRGWLHEVCLNPDDFLAHAGSIFREHPVEVVRLLGRKPLCISDGNWTWWNVETTRDTATANEDDGEDLPGAIWALLDGDHRDLRDEDRMGFKWYATKQDALNALNAACYRYGREAACAT